MQKAAIYIVSLLIVSYLGFQAYNLQSERMELKGEYEEAHAELEELRIDSERLYEEIEYVSEPHNLEKELRSRFNYKFPFEKLIIVVPEEEEATTTENVRD